MYSCLIILAYTQHTHNHEVLKECKKLIRFQDRIIFDFLLQILRIGFILYSNAKKTYFCYIKHNCEVKLKMSTF